MLKINLKLLILLLICPTFIFGQKVAYISSDSILKQIPEYGLHIQKIDSMRRMLSRELETTQNSLQDQYNKITKPYFPKENETVEQLIKRMNPVDTLNLHQVLVSNRQLQEKKQLYDKLLQDSYKYDIQPILDRINATVSAFAKKNKIAVVFILEQIRNSAMYIDPKQNITNEIIKNLNYK